MMHAMLLYAVKNHPQFKPGLDTLYYMVTHAVRKHGTAIAARIQDAEGGAEDGPDPPVHDADENEEDAKDETK